MSIVCPERQTNKVNTVCGLAVRDTNRICASLRKKCLILPQEFWKLITVGEVFEMNKEMVILSTPIQKKSSKKKLEKRKEWYEIFFGRQEACRNRVTVVSLPRAVVCSENYTVSTKYDFKFSSCYFKEVNRNRWIISLLFTSVISLQFYLSLKYLNTLSIF